VASHSWCQITPLTQRYLTPSPPPNTDVTVHPKLLQLETSLRVIKNKIQRTAY